MASRKEEKERLRAQRLAAERRDQQAARKRLMLGYGAAAVLGLAVVAGIVVAVAGSGGGGGSDSGACAEAHIQGGALLSGAQTFGAAPDCRKGTPPPPVQHASLKDAAKIANCDLRLNLPDEGNSHVGGTVQYHTKPPTSGNHNPIPQSDGAYSQEPQPEHFVHTLEHGRVEIQYQPSLPEADQLALKGLFDSSPGGMLLFPNADMPYQVAATAWTQLVGCKQYDGAKTLDVLADFRTQYRGHGPEPFPITP